ncbi:MAG: ATP-binding protein, partial [Leptolyngbya sp. SIO3F4]|nr:ATP-binding protein [Leptolyngbya sp. SIO3F4]
LGVVYGVITGVATGVAIGVAYGVVAGVAYGVVYGVVIGVAVGVAIGVMTGEVAFGVLVGVAFGIGLWVNWWRPVLLTGMLMPWHWLLYRFDQSRHAQLPSLLHKHLAFWDEWQYLPIPGLDKHLLLILEKRPDEGQAALDYLSTGRQRWVAQAAQIELDARYLEHCDTAVAIGQIYKSLTVGELQGPADTLLRSFIRISNDVAASLSQESTYNQRLSLSSIAERLDGLIRELTRSSDQYAARFRPIAQRWSNIVALTIEDLTKESELRQEIDSPYIIGVPLNQQQAVFVGRTDISARIEQLLLDRRRPPLLLYGQRRTGKTSLLNNLGRLLPQSVVPLFIDLQGPASRAKDNTGFLYNLTKEMVRSAQDQRSLTLPSVSRQDLADDPFTVFDEWLDVVETTLGENNTALLALDEFEVLDKALVDGRFNETDILGMLRNLIQNRPRFKVMIAGSHTLKEFQRWSSYLINAQTIHLGYLKESEARQLIEHPLKDFALRYEPDASQRVLDVTRGHPFLVQLLSGEIVAYKNEQDPSIRRLATLADVDAAIPEALESGSMFFSDIEGNQVDDVARAILQYIASQGEGGIARQSELVQHISGDLESALDLLLRRELIEATADGYGFQVELIRRWFAES